MKLLNNNLFHMSNLLSFAQYERSNVILLCIVFLVAISAFINKMMAY